jgi:hypothetical protein
MEGCDRHLEVIEILDDLDDRVKYLELRDTATSLMLENLITRVDKLVKTIEDFMAATRRGVVGTGGAIIATLFGFLIWYIQTH